MGPPGSGKGTQSDLLKEKFGLYHVSTGDLLRAEIKKETEIGKQVQQLMAEGKYVPESIVINMIKDKLLSDECKGGVILDGFPRTVHQAEALDQMLQENNMKIDHVIQLEVDDVAMVERVAGRFTCAKCGKGYHEITHPPAQEGVCDVCGGTEFTRRPDDNAEAMEKRLEVYYESTRPVIPYYQERGVFKVVNGMGDIQTIAKEIENILS